MITSLILIVKSVGTFYAIPVIIITSVSKKINEYIRRRYKRIMKLVLEKFSKSFGPVSVIENLDLTVHSGEMLALLGPSGCGKSTTLFSICGIYRMNSGKLLFDQKDMSNVPSQQRNVGVVFQNYALYPHMTVYENIAFPLKLKKLDSKIVDEKVQEIANLVYRNYLKESPHNFQVASNNE